MKKLTKALIIVLSIFMIGFPVNGKSITKKYVTMDNFVKVVYIATNMESIIKKELNHKILEVYSLAYETIFGEP